MTDLEFSEILVADADSLKDGHTYLERVTASKADAFGNCHPNIKALYVSVNATRKDGDKSLWVKMRLDVECQALNFYEKYENFMEMFPGSTQGRFATLVSIENSAFITKDAALHLKVLCDGVETRTKTLPIDFV